MCLKKILSSWWEKPATNQKVTKNQQQRKKGSYWFLWIFNSIILSEQCKANENLYIFWLLCWFSIQLWMEIFLRKYYFLLFSNNYLNAGFIFCMQLVNSRWALRFVQKVLFLAFANKIRFSAHKNAKWNMDLVLFKVAQRMISILIIAIALSTYTFLSHSFTLNKWIHEKIVYLLPSH